MSGQHEVIGFLSRADSYGCPGGTVERIETHGSLIFLCGERVYKLKREIAYASLDFLTLEKQAPRIRSWQTQLISNLT